MNKHATSTSIFSEALSFGGSFGPSSFVEPQDSGPQHQALLDVNELCDRLQELQYHISNVIIWDWIVLLVFNVTLTHC